MVRKICRTWFLWLLFGGISLADKPYEWQINFQEAATPVMESIHTFHHQLLWIIAAIALVVTSLLVYVVWRFRASKNPVPATFTHHTGLEIIWTAIPVVLLVIIAIPSLKLLHLMDKLEKPELTLKVTGHQWFWEYDYPESDINFNSLPLTKDQLKEGDVRLLSVDQQVVLPVDTDVRILVTSADVLHSWAVPAFGVKQDTVPGRLRETWVRITKPGTYYGQCSELCGQGHGYMPIAVKAVSKEEFKAWLESHKKPKAPAAAPAKGGDTKAADKSADASGSAAGTTGKAGTTATTTTGGASTADKTTTTTQTSGTVAPSPEKSPQANSIDKPEASGSQAGTTPAGGANVTPATASTATTPGQTTTPEKNSQLSPTTLNARRG